MVSSQRHSYHLVYPSPWRLISGLLGALATTVGGVIYMHSNTIDHRSTMRKLIEKF